MKVPRSSLMGGILFAGLAATWIVLRVTGLVQLRPVAAVPAYLDYVLLVMAAGLFGAVLITDANRLARARAATKRIEESLRQQQSYVNALAHAADQISAYRSLPEVLNSICAEAAIALGADAATIALVDPSHGLLEPAAQFGLSNEVLRSMPYSDSDLSYIWSDRPVAVAIDSPWPGAQFHAGLQRSKAFNTLIQMPLRAAEQMIGIFSLLAHAHDKPLTPDQEAMFRGFAAQAGLAVRADWLMAEMRSSRSKLESLRAGDLAILSSLDLRTTLNVFLQKVVEHLSVDAADVLLLDAASQTLEFAAGTGFQTGALAASRVALGEGFAGKVAMERRNLIVPNVNAEKPFTRRELILGEGVISYFGTPLIAKGRVLGVLEAFHRKPFRPDVTWLAFLHTLAGQASIAIDNAALFSKLQQAIRHLEQAYDRTLQGWSRALDLRDRETEGHSQRVTDMCLRLARELDTPEESLVHIRRGALLHDIGKMGIPDQVLFKADAYDGDDQRIMQTHPALAYEMLAPIAFLQPALDIPYCHHERWDGTGYPRGLSGEAIPLAARIFSVVDVWDAMTRDRPYRKALSEAGALQHLREQAGFHFDPRVVEAFERLITKEAAQTRSPSPA